MSIQDKIEEIRGLVEGPQDVSASERYMTEIGKPYAITGTGKIKDGIDRLKRSKRVHEERKELGIDKPDAYDYWADSGKKEIALGAAQIAGTAALAGYAVHKHRKKKQDADDDDRPVENDDLEEDELEESVDEWDKLFVEADDEASANDTPTEPLPDTPAEPADDGESTPSADDAATVPEPEAAPAEPAGDTAEGSGDAAASDPPPLEEPAPEGDGEGEADTSVLDEISEKIHLSGPETELLTGLIDSETDAITDYASALNETKNKYARKLYTEILSDESKHLAQLRYLKSMSDDSGYVPKDQEAVQELSKTLESIQQKLGVMDELKAKVDAIFNPTDTL